MKKQIKIAYFPSDTSKDKILSSNGRSLDMYCVKGITDEDLSGNYIIDLTFRIDDNIQALLQEEVILKVLMDYGNEIFRISKVTVGTRYIDVVARQITIADSLTLWLEDIRPTNLNGQAAASWLLDGAEGKKEIQIVSDIDTIATAYYQRMNLYKALHDNDNSFLNRWGGEIQRRGYTIYIKKRIGTDRGFSIREGKNLTGFEGSSNIDNLVTRAIGEGYNGILGNYIDSPLISAYNRIYTSVIKYDDVKVKSENDEEGYNTLEQAQAELDRRINEEFSKNDIDKIKASYNVNFVQLEKTEEYKNYIVAERLFIGDDCRVYIPKLSVDIKVRAMSRKYDILAQKTKEIKLSNYIDIKTLSIKQVIERLESIDSTETILQLAKDNATSLIKSGLKNSYVIPRENEIIIGDTKDINTMIKVWRWNNGGLGFSNTGYYGEFGTAITQDGAIVADFITTGILNASLIKTGILRSFNNKTWIDMEQGTFNFHDKIKFDGNNFEVDLSTNEKVSSIEKLTGTNLIKNGDFVTNIDGWIKTGTISIARSTKTDGTTWANIYSSNTEEVYVYSEVECSASFGYEFSMSLAYYSSNKKLYRIRLYEVNSIGTETLIKEFTGETEGTTTTPDALSYSFKTSSTATKLKLYIGKLSTEVFDIYVTNIVIGSSGILAKSSMLKLLNSQIATKVSENEVCSIVEQNPTSVKIGFNAINDTVEITPSWVHYKNSSGKKSISFNYGRMYMYDPTTEAEVGRIGVNTWTGTSIYGLHIGQKQDSYLSLSKFTGSLYEAWFYLNFGSIPNQPIGLHLGNDLYANNWKIVNPSLYWEKNTDYGEIYLYSTADNNTQLRVVIGDNEEDEIWFGTKLVGNSTLQTTATMDNSKIDFYKQLDMHNWGIVNSGGVKSLSYEVVEPVSTFALYNEDGIENYSEEELILNGSELRTAEKTYGVVKTNTPNTEWCGTNKIVDGKCIIELPQDIIYSSYTVQLTSIGRNQIYLMEKNDHNFLVESDNDCSFDFIVKFIDVEVSLARSLSLGSYSGDNLICEDNREKPQTISSPITEYESAINQYWQLYKKEEV